jgi:hypothetical protein
MLRRIIAAALAASLASAACAGDLYRPGFRPGLSRTAPVAPSALAYLGTNGSGTGNFATTVTTTNTGVSVLQHDIILQGIMLTDSTTAVDHNPSCPSGYALLMRGSPTTEGRTTTAYCWKAAATNSESTAVTWPTWTGTADQGGIWTTTVIRGADQTTPFEASAKADIGAVSDTATFDAPSVTTITASDLLLTFTNGWFANTFTVPTGMTRDFFLSGGTRDVTAQNYQALTSPGVTGSRPTTASRPDVGTSYTFAVKPS